MNTCISCSAPIAAYKADRCVTCAKVKAIQETAARYVGQRFGRLVIIEYVPGSKYPKSSARVTCICDCGAVHETKAYYLRSGGTTSCGCYHREMVSELSQPTHGKSRTVEYMTLARMKQRCYSPNSSGWENYGAIGITICDRWLDKEHGFENFFADMGERPEGKSIDRWPNLYGNYEPNNTRWATWEEQARNRRNNRMVIFDNRIQCIAAWAEETGLDYSTIWMRLEAGWTSERIFTTPVRDH